MKRVSVGEAEEFRNGETCVVSEYPLGDEGIDVAVAKIDGRYPDEGWARNKVSKEMAFVLKGQGKLVCEDEEVELSEGDAIFIVSGEKFYWEGKMSLLISCAPAWKYAQYEHIIEENK